MMVTGGDRVDEGLAKGQPGIAKGASQLVV